MQSSSPTPVSRARVPVWRGVACAVAVAVFAVVFAVAVAEMEAKIYQDGKRAVEGFGHGYMTFGVLALIAVFAFGRFYKAIIGARVWVVIGLLLPPALGVAYLFLH